MRIRFPMVKDYDQKLANRLQADRTPEVFLLDDRFTFAIEDVSMISIYWHCETGGNVERTAGRHRGGVEG